jgi:hypothetical protein
MRHKLALGLLAAAIPTGFAVAKSVGNFDSGPPTFELIGRPIGGAQPAGATAAHLTSTRIAAIG